MSISLPRFTRRETPLLGRSHRARAIVFTGLRREFRRPASIFAIAVGTLITTVTSIFFVLFAPFLLQGQPLDLTFFYLPASNLSILFFVTLMAAIVGSGLVADDLRTMALTLYLSRPITQADYLTAKAAVLGPLVAMIAILPLAITPIVAALLGFFAWSIALHALGLSLVIGFVLTAFYTSIALFLSSLTSRKAYAAAGIFAVTFGLTIPAQLLASAINQPALLYLSPWEDFLAVARGAFGVGGGPIDWAPALIILLGETVFASLATYVRMRALEVITG